jgi:ATP-dependent Clp protease protease subunit
MIHQPLAGMEGTATELEIHAKEVRRVKQRMNEILLEAHRAQRSKKLKKTLIAITS